MATLTVDDLRRLIEGHPGDRLVAIREPGDFTFRAPRLEIETLRRTPHGLLRDYHECGYPGVEALVIG